MDALIFDFDGVIVDSEPIHLACFARVLAGSGISLSREDYYTKYLGFDDHDCFAAVLAANGKTATEEEIDAMTAVKTQMVQQTMRTSIKALPGAAELIASASAAGIPLAICSGALKDEIELAATTINVLHYFSVIISAKDVSRGKPDPQGYRLALDRLSSATGRLLDESKCVVVEDAPAGIQAAHAAGMKVLAVATSYPPAALQAADKVAASLAQVTAQNLNTLI